MRHLFAFVLCFTCGWAEYSPNYFCADVDPQPTVDIPQLLGMWFGIEKIDHLNERHYIKSVPSCPIIHLSEDHPTTTMHPLYKNSPNYGYGGGQAYVTGIPTYPKSMNERQRAEYDRKTTYGDHPVRRMHYNGQNYGPHGPGEHYLRMMWDENRESTEYHVRYNDSRRGFWISSGPENGVVLRPEYSHFAGTIQVLKAVGEHMVLTICHRLPKSQLFSIILSREPKLEGQHISGIHRMLIRRGLNTNYVEKMCNNNGSRFTISKTLSIFWFIFLICRIFK